MKVKRYELYIAPKDVDDKTPKKVLNPETGKLEVPVFHRRGKAKEPTKVYLCPHCHNVVSITGICDFCGEVSDINKCSYLVR